MPHVGHEVVDKLLHVFSKVVSTSLLVVLFFILQYILDMKFRCSCKPGLHYNGVLYLTVPPLILTWVLFNIESVNQRRFCEFKNKCLANLCSCCSQILLKVITVTAIWISGVLFDGDWYYCFITNYDSNHTGMPCKDESTLADDEKRFRNELKIESLEYGLFLISGVFAIWTMATFLSSCHFRRRQYCYPPYYKIVYKDLLAEQVNHHLKEKLTKLAEERAVAICQKDLQIIEDYEKNASDRTTEAENSWHKISALDFYMPLERQNEEEEDGPL